MFVTELFCFSFDHLGSSLKRWAQVVTTKKAFHL